jgi:glycosyltransferase involved in cell wall biosynthesis
MHILHIVPYYAPAWTYGGVVSAVTGLATAQALRGNQVTVLTTDTLSPVARNPFRREEIDGVTVIRCRNLSNTIRGRYNLSQPIGFRQAFQQIAGTVDVIHAHELRTVENLLISRPFVLSPHGTLSHDTGRSAFKRGWDVLFGRMLLRKVQRVAALTSTEAEEAQSLWAMLKLPFPGAGIIPNGIPANFTVEGDLRSRYRLGSGPVVLFLGRLHERKGLQYLIPAFAQAARDLADARLLIVGPDEGMLAAAQNLAQQVSMVDRILFTGMLIGADQRAAYASADIFVLPAVGEGLSMAVLEAMAANLPVILTPGCNLPDVEIRGAGLLVSRDIEALAQAIQVLLLDENKRRIMGQQGYTWAHESFTWPAIAAQTELLYKELG